MSASPELLPPPARPVPRKLTAPTSQQRLLGLLCGLIAAAGYTLANMALRHSARPDDFDWSIWVTAHKAVPATVMTWVLVWGNFRRGVQALPDRSLILPLIATGLVMQFAGNLCFQYALGLIGLAMTVPIAFALILVSGAIFSRLFLGEPITARTVLALSTLIAAVTLLSAGAGASSRTILHSATGLQILQGVGMAMISGIGYGVCGVVIRRNVRHLPVSATLVFISTTGVIAVGGVGLIRLPLETILATSRLETCIMLLAGVFNAGAFYCLGVSLRYLNVTQVNMINTTQIAMATMAGVLFFAEPLTAWLVAGVLMTAVGLYLMDRQ